MTIHQLVPGCILHHADCREALRAIPSDSLDSCVTDPPYALVSTLKRFANSPRSEAAMPTAGPYARASRGFMGCKWDTGETAFTAEFWAEVLRVLKPGAFVAAFGASRGYHRMACAIEDAGFEIRDSLLYVHDPADPIVAFMESLSSEQLSAFLRCIDDSEFGGLLAWMYGTGFPKSHDLSKQIDKRKNWVALEMLASAIKTARVALGISQSEAARRVGLIGPDETLGGGGFMWFETGRMPTRDEWPRIKSALSLSDEFDASFEAAEREVIGEQTHGRGDAGTWTEHTTNDASMFAAGERTREITRPLSAFARAWEGWGTALKPAFEPIVLARKPLSEGTVAGNVLRWRTGALNIDGCRVDAQGETVTTSRNIALGSSDGGIYGAATVPGVYEMPAAGRWPANVVTDGSPEVVGYFPNSPGQLARARTDGDAQNNAVYGSLRHVTAHPEPRNDLGSAARFFYSAKASKADRAGSKHPTVKPIALMRWLARLITPPGGTILEPFAGSGTTGAAALAEGFRIIMCEREAEYVADIRRRITGQGSDLSAQLARHARRVELAAEISGRLAKASFSC